MSKIKSTGLLGLGLCAAFAGTGCAGSTSNASVAVQQSVQASGLASSSAAHALAASGQAALAVSSVPLAIGGVVLSGAGAASMGAAKASMNIASAPAALPVTDQTITVIPPSQALQK
jgi:hypothetical protein